MGRPRAVKGRCHLTRRVATWKAKGGKTRIDLYQYYRSTPGERPVKYYHYTDSSGGGGTLRTPASSLGQKGKWKGGGGASYDSIAVSEMEAPWGGGPYAQAGAAFVLKEDKPSLKQTMGPKGMTFNNPIEGPLEERSPRYTTTLNRRAGGATVSAHKNGDAYQFMNRTQAEKHAQKVGGEVYKPAFLRVYYVKVKPDEGSYMSSPASRRSSNGPGAGWWGEPGRHAEAARLGHRRRR